MHVYEVKYTLAQYGSKRFLYSIRVAWRFSTGDQMLLLLFVHAELEDAVVVGRIQILILWYDGTYKTIIICCACVCVCACVRLCVCIHKWGGAREVRARERVEARGKCQEERQSESARAHTQY